MRIIGVLMLVASSFASAAPCGADLRGAVTAESANYLVAFRTQPPRIAVGKHFSVEFETCVKGDAPAFTGVAVDAFMPEHGHGMNYRAVVKPAAGAKPPNAPTIARYRADGLMFHMPGRWDFYFDVRSASGTERATRSVVLE